MKKILITGANSYIGTSFENWLKRYPDKYEIDTIDMIDNSWRGKKFSKYDVVFHVAGIAHVSSDPKLKDLYYKVNRDLAIETAIKAKAEGVRQFIFMSSIITYGDSAPIGKEKLIRKDTPLNPVNYYADSKVQAENGIIPLSSQTFKVVIIRPPIIYGKGCKGNYATLSKMALKIPLWPKLKSSRSVLYIGNLVEFLRLMIENEEEGIFWPQNREWTNTSEIVKLIAEVHGKKVRLVRGFQWVLRLVSHFTGLVNKAFGSLAYDIKMSEYKEEYQIFSLADSIKQTEI